MKATDYYTAPNATGDGSCAESPMALTTAVGKLVAGDNLYLLDGQYNLSSTLKIGKSGAVNNLIFIGAYKNSKPILDFRKEAYGSHGVDINADYVHIKGITVRYAGKQGFQNNGSFNIMELMDVYGNSDTGMQQKGGNCNVILNCDSHDNFDYEKGGITAADFGGNADGFGDKQYTASPGNTYVGCRSWNNADDGWDFYQRVGGTTVFINCICFQNGPATFDLSNFPRLETDAAWFNQFAGDGIIITDDGGTTHKCSLKAYYNNGNGNGFKIGGNSTKHDVLLFRCLSLGNSVKGFDQNSDAGKIQIYNCTSYANGCSKGSNYGFYNDNGYSLDIENCISLDSKGSNSFKCSNLVSEDNTWNSGFSVSTSDFVSIDTTKVLAPRNGDGSLSESSLLHLNVGSKLIGVGADLTSKLSEITGRGYSIGNTKDLGCFEYNSSTADINNINKDSSCDDVAAIFFINGIRMSSMQKGGPYIIKYKSGRTVKAMR
jgi:hypothetical protein